jgi:hypothetical protein
MQSLYRTISRVINGNLGFGDGTNTDNISGVWKSVTITLADTDITVTHNLGRIPVGYLVMSKTQACDIYDGSVAPTTTQITLKGSVAGAIVKLFII